MLFCGQIRQILRSGGLPQTDNPRRFTTVASPISFSFIRLRGASRRQEPARRRLDILAVGRLTLPYDKGVTSSWRQRKSRPVARTGNPVRMAMSRPVARISVTRRPVFPRDEVLDQIRSPISESSGPGPGGKTFKAEPGSVAPCSRQSIGRSSQRSRLSFSVSKKKALAGSNSMATPVPDTIASSPLVSTTICSPVGVVR